MAKQKPETPQPDATSQASPGSGEDLAAVLQGAANSTGQPDADTDPVVQASQADNSAPASSNGPGAQAAAGQAAAAAGQPQPDASQSQTDQFDLLAEMQNLGFSDVKDEREAMRRLVAAQRQAAEQLQSMGQLAQYGREFAELATDPAFQQFYAQRQATPAPIRGTQFQQAQQPQQPASATTAAQADWCPIPSNVDLALINKFREVKIDPATGQQVADFKPNTPMQVRQEYDRYVAGVEQFTHELTTNPRAVLNRYRDAEVLPMVRDVIREELGRANVQQTQQSLSQRIAAENPWLFERDARTGQVLVNRVTGEAVLTPEGQQAYEMLQALSPSIPDPAMAWELTRSHVVTRNPELARRLLFENGGSPAPAAATTPAAPAVQPTAAARQTQRNYLQAAAAASTTPANRDGAAAQPGTTQQRPGRRRTSGHDLIENLTAMGVSVAD